MVQIFVKVNGSKVTPIELNLTDDKVEDIIRQVQNDEERVCDNARGNAQDKRKAEVLRSH